MAKGWAAPGWRLGAVGLPVAPLMDPSLFLRENNSRKFLDDFEKLPRTTFLQQKDSRKQELALWHLVNRLVPEKCIKMI